MSTLLVVLVGVGVGVAFGALGGGGSALATPALAFLGVPAAVAVASPLPALVPAALVGARQYLRSGDVDRSAARLALLAGFPAALLGASMSRFVGGSLLLEASAALIGVVGVRMLVPVHDAARSVRAAVGTRTAADGTADVDGGAEVAGTAEVAGATPGGLRRLAVVVLLAAAAFLSGLLANGGGLLLVPILVLGVGLGTAPAAGTSMVVAAALVVPTLVVHTLLGHVDWTVAAAFAVGAIPASAVGGRIGLRLPDATARRAFGALLVGCGLLFVATHLL